MRAYRLAAIGNGFDIQRTAARVTGAPRALLRAVMLQSDGDVSGATMILRRQFMINSGVEKAAIADTLAPILIMRHEFDVIPELIQALEANGWYASAHAFRAMLLAIQSRHREASHEAKEAEKALLSERDAIGRARVLQRLARSRYLLKDYEKAIDLALSGAEVAVREKAWRVAGACYSILYNFYHSVTGDMTEADRFAGMCREVSLKSGDLSLEQLSLVAQFEIAVQFGEDVRINVIERRLQRRLLPEQYRERFPLQFSRALALGKRDLIGMRTVLQVLRDSPSRTRGQWALATALVALSFAAEGDDEATRLHAREAVSRLGRASSSDAAYEKRDRRLARVALAVACVLVGDDVRGERILNVQECYDGEGEYRILTNFRHGDWETVPRSLKGISQVFKLASEHRNATAPPFGLTRSELDVLRLFADGRSAVKIAHDSDRSVNTIYNHSRAILGKLEVSRIPEAVAIARKRGILPL